MDSAITNSRANVPSFTTMVGVDNEHAEELEISWPTWQRFRPEILENPMLLICDGKYSAQYWRKRLSFVDHKQLSIELWSSPRESQRAKMLAGLTYGPCKWVSTDWYLKLDTDVIAVEHADWINRNWFLPNEAGITSAFIAPPWRYTKPANSLEELDKWANQISYFDGTAPLNLAVENGQKSIAYPRIISWCFFGNTHWTREIAALAPQGLPVDSHDTFLWYCAHRLRHRFTRFRMKKLGWRHISNRRRLEKTQRIVLEQNKRDLKEQQEKYKSSTRLKRLEYELPKRRSTRGVIYLLTGKPHAVRLIVSLWTLRMFYDGPVTLFTTRAESHQIGELCALDRRLAVDHRRLHEAGEGKNSSFLTKASYFEAAPYEINVHVDCDTLISGDISPLFEVSDERPFVATQFADWRTTKPLIRRRIAKWLDIPERRCAPESYRQIVGQALEDGPAINSGVFSFRHNASILNEWHRWTNWGRDTFICDEVALQILLPQFPHQILDCRFNCSPVYRAQQIDARIWHFHGRKHLKRDNARELWLPVYDEVCRENVAKVADWTPLGDKKLQRYLKGIGVESELPRESLGVQ